MWLKELTITNFMPFKGKNKIILEKGLINIVGEWDKQKERSNRAGKSSFIEAIIYLLYGRGRAIRETSLINNHSNYMLVEGKFGCDGKDIVIKRGRDNENNLTLEIDGVEYKKEEAQQIIDELVGLNYNEFKLTCYFGQGDINSFMNLTQAARKDILQKWISSFDWSVCEEIVRKHIKQIETDLITNESCYNMLENQLEDYELLDLDDLYELLEAEKQALKENLLHKRDLENTYRNTTTTEYEEKAYSYKKELEFVKKEIELLQSLLIQSENVEEEHKRFKKELIDEKRLLKDLKKDLEQYNEYESIKKNRQNIQSEYFSKRRDYKEFLNALRRNTYMCPILKEHCDRISDKEYIENQKKEKKKELDEIEKELNEIEEEYENVKKIRNEIKISEKNIDVIKAHLEEKQRQIELIEEKGDIKSELQKVKDRYKKLLKTIETTIEKRDKVKRRLARLEDEIEAIQDDITKNHQNISTFNASITEHKKKLKEIELHKEKMQGYKKTIRELTDKKDKYRFILSMFSKQGLPMLEVNKYMTQLQNFVNDILDRLNTNMKVVIETEKKLTTLEPECYCGFIYNPGSVAKNCPECGRKRQNKIRNDFGIIIYHNNNPTPFELDSGGGKSLISIAIRLALIDMLRLKKKVKLNILILDEIFGMLDVTNKLLVNELVHYLKNEYKQIYVITHSNVHFTADQIIKIKKGVDYSGVETF